MSTWRHIERGPTRSALAGLVATVLLAACSSHSSPAKGNIDVTVHSLVTATITSLQLTVQSASVLASPLKIPLAITGNQASALIKNLSVASDYAITVDAIGTSNVAVARGTAVAVVIKSGQTTSVLVYLNEIIEPTPYSNTSPLIDAITLSAETVPPGGQIALTGLAHDPDAGQTATLQFAWAPEANCGTISGAHTTPGTDADHPSQSTATWTAPSTSGICSITLSVKDIYGLSNRATFQIQVSADSGVGAATVTAVIEEGPEIVGITVTPGQLSSIGPNQGVVGVVVANPDNTTLQYAWSADPTAPCTVEFGTPTMATTTFQATATGPDATYCTFMATVDEGVWSGVDALKNPSTAKVTLAMTNPVVAQVPPVFGIAYQSYDTVVPSVTAMFGAIAVDPEGGTLSYTWSASSGVAPAPSSASTLGLDSAFTTAATWTVPTDANSQSGALFVTVTATSSISKLSSSITFTLAP